MSATSTSRLEKTDWYGKQLKSVRLLERVKSKYKSQFNTNATAGNRPCRPYSTEKPRFDPSNHDYPRHTSSLSFLNDEAGYYFRGNSSKLSSLSRATKIESARSARSAKSVWSAQSRIVIESPLQLPGKKVIKISGLSKGMCVPSIVAQVTGGGLEKLVYHENENWLEVFFLSTVNARKFMSYCCETGLFVVNGKSLLVEWSSSPEAKASEKAPLPNYVVEEVEMSKASRVVILSQHVPGQSSGLASTRKYPNPRAKFSEGFRIETVKWDFIAFGGIVEVAPIISLVLSVSIQFKDIRSALLAMRSMKQETSMLRTKYPQWTLQYGKDPAERPCYAV